MATKREAVFAAADSLKAQGIRPTIENVRHITGGSYTTLTPLIKEWKDKEEAKKNDTAPVPDEISNLGDGLVHQIWSIANKDADARFAGEREVFRVRLDELRAESQEVVAAADAHLERIQHMEAAAAQANETMDTLRAQLEGAERARDEAIARAERSEQLANDAQAQCDAMTAELDKLREFASTAGEVKERLQAQVANLEGQVSQLESQNTKLIQAIPGAQD